MKNIYWDQNMLCSSQQLPSSTEKILNQKNCKMIKKKKILIRGYGSLVKIYTVG